MATASAGALAMAAARAVADAVLYEGYLLYPYRSSSGKNQNRIRWQFGVLLPPAWARSHGLDDTGVAGSAESWWQQTECLLNAAPASEVEVCVRFLQVQRRVVDGRGPDGDNRPAGEPRSGQQAELGFDEAVPQEFTVRARVADLLAVEQRVLLKAAGGQEAGPWAGADGMVGRVVRQRRTVTASALIAGEPCSEIPGLVRLRVRIENTGTLPAQAPREEALRSSLVACHVLLAVRDGSFLSLLDPPAAARRAARACANVHTFPVLAGQEGQQTVMLSSPIILYDHPQIAPESPGDLHDATEIDEILSLRALTLTEAEKTEARATDQRAAAILDRIEAMPPEVLSRLHGAVRSLRSVASPQPPAGGTGDLGAPRRSPSERERRPDAGHQRGPDGRGRAAQT